MMRENFLWEHLGVKNEFNINSYEGQNVGRGGEGENLSRILYRSYNSFILDKNVANIVLAHEDLNEDLND